MTARPVSVLDLTVDQVERIELEVGRPLMSWREAPSTAALYRAIYVAATGTDAATVGAMTLRELTDAVTLDDDESTEGAETVNPT